MPESKDLTQKKGAAGLSARCPLCGGGAELFFEAPDKAYYRCGECLGIFLDRMCRVSPETEKRRYKEHNNDVNDPRYQKFVEPVVSKVKERFTPLKKARTVRERGFLKGFTPEHKGLDYGAGTGPVAAKLLRDEGYSVELYDPFFWKKPAVLNAKYDFIVCCEVCEHFHSPAKEFKRLRFLLKSGGVLYCMTDLYSENIDFKNWYYKNDPTHVFFYHEKTLERIKEQFGFVSVEQNGRITLFFK